ncbi:type II toxin-antitoxin system HigB family toxin [Burkholderia sp. B21-007]|uniref:type II toxin-antitoxin system HigB family toxin n=1 Tax=Burkholderia sp. B21-007 TaxID=2890407 RepID=UPI001E45A684|nr:type II toxin-antitoxin system HigB family toxin [Burkholderia sp. B21-007]UEP28013.1 type II toxin-antitoxin system HigB family toxin [Burkholderia sp. B21-007]
MRLLGKDKLQVALDKDAQLWLRSWISELVSAHWKDAAELLAQFPRATATGADTFIFRVGAAVWNIELAVHFPQEIALVVSMERAAS